MAIVSLTAFKYLYLQQENSPVTIEKCLFKSVNEKITAQKNMLKIDIMNAKTKLSTKIKNIKGAIINSNFNKRIFLYNPNLTNNLTTLKDSFLMPKVVVLIVLR